MPQPHTKGEANYHTWLQQTSWISLTGEKELKAGISCVQNNGVFQQQPPLLIVSYMYTM